MANILCLCSEPSGDRLMAQYVREFKRTGHVARGIGGKWSIDEGLEAIFHIDKLSAIGLVEAAGALPAHIHAYSKLVSQLGWADRVFIVDSPELGLRLVKHAYRHRVPTAYLAPPQAWAWRPWRARVLRRCDWVGCLFPFEQNWFEKQGVRTTYVGHAAFYDLPLQKVGDIRHVALLPGSRDSSIERMMPVFVAAAVQLHRHGLVDHFYLGLRRTSALSKSNQRLLDSHSFISRANDAADALSKSGLALAHFGTITLECVLSGRPVIAAGVVHPLTYLLAKPFVKTPFFALPNLLLGQASFPELVQDDCQSARFVEAYRGLTECFEDALGECAKIRRIASEIPDSATRSLFDALQIGYE